MSWGFRKTFKILPAVRINLTHTGISTILGPRGANINIRKDGVYNNVNITGTGLYSREKIITYLEKGKRSDSIYIPYQSELIKDFLR